MWLQGLLTFSFVGHIYITVLFCSALENILDMFEIITPFTKLKQEIGFSMKYFIFWEAPGCFPNLSWVFNIPLRKPARPGEMKIDSRPAVSQSYFQQELGMTAQDFRVSVSSSVKCFVEVLGVCWMNEWNNNNQHLLNAHHRG